MILPVDVNNTYRIFRDNYGVVNAVNRIWDGASLAYNWQTKEFDETDPLTIELRQWEQENGALDLSDFPPDPQPEPSDPDPGDPSGDLIL